MSTVQLISEKYQKKTYAVCLENYTLHLSESPDKLNYRESESAGVASMENILNTNLSSSIKPSGKPSSGFWHKEKQNGFWVLTDGKTIWKVLCYFCKNPMKDSEKVHYHHISYSPEIKRLSHAKCHEQKTHSKIDPFPDRYQPKKKESQAFYRKPRTANYKEPEVARGYAE